MAIRQSDLLAAARTSTVRVTKAMVEEAQLRGRKTVFLCHSHKDAELVKGLVEMLHKAGWNAYVDWMDHEMPARPNRRTAENIQKRIRDSTFFMFLATQNSMASRWCPWEIGYADGKKPIDNIFVVTTRDTAGSTHGNEYLDLYRRIDFATDNSLAAWRPGMTTSGVVVSSL